MSKTPNSKENIHINSVAHTFPIAGIGASAGGLDAIRKLLEYLPEKTGLAFIIVQHLATGQESLLTEILSRSTKIPVSQVQNEMPVEPDHVYVIPPGKTMTISRGVLELLPKDVSLKPIDEFLSSLAKDRKTQAIGIVLSGTGTDGTEGLKFIKAEGGITFAQDPKSAQYPDMPKNAIAAETVYFVLAPEQIAKELSRISRHPEILRQKMESAEPREQEETDIETIFTLLKASFGVNFANYKKSTTSRRIARRMVLNKIENLRKYVTYLRAHKEELQALFDDMLIGVTGFFREPKTFELLRGQVFPNIIDEKPNGHPIRIWIPGCSTGEEVYSVAIAVREFVEEKNNVGMQIQIFGTDVNEKNIEKARKGIYLKNIEENMPEKQLKRFFAPVNGNYQVAKQIRDMCIFAKHDITKDPPFSSLNLIICRNLLIYFDSKLQEKIMPLFHYGLKPNGYLVLGEAESVGKYPHLFEPLTKKGVIFKKKMSQPNLNLQLEASTPRFIGKLVEKPERADYVALLEKQVDHILMADYIPASLFLNSNLDILVFRGKIDPYISIDSGATSFNVARIIRKELRPAIQTGVYRAKKEKKDILITVRLTKENKKKTVNVQIKPVRLLKNEELFFLVLFTEPLERKLSTQETQKISKKDETENAKDQQIKELSEDLDSTKQTLQTVIEQQEATNEELRSAMEEIQSSNEELMSTNEELETSKEELQSANEELTTLNEELKNRNESLSQLNDDLANLMGNVDTAVVIVDSNFKIRRFTNSAQALLRLMSSDVDHTISDIRLGIPIEELEKLLSKVVTNFETVRQEIQTDRGRWYQLRVRPYLTVEKKVGGAVLSFADVTEMKKFEEEKKVYADNLELTVKDQAGKLITSENLATIGKTAGMVGHDIRNPLQVIVGNVDLLEMKLALLPEGELKKGMEESTGEIERAAGYIDKIVLDLQDFARPLKPQIVETDLEKLLRSLLEMADVPDGIEVSLRVDKPARKMLTDPDFLRRIMLNLVSNAVQSIDSGGGTIGLHAFREGKDIVIAVKDSGKGIPKEIRSQLFTPLFTTKAKGQGFGLPVVKRMTEAMGGTAKFASREGKGTIFTVRLPQR